MKQSKKTICAAVFLLLCAPLFLLSASAREAASPEDYYSQVYAGIDEETRRLLESAGVDGADLYALTSLSPDNLFAVLRELFGTALSEKAKLFGVCFALMIGLRFFLSFLSSKPIRETAEHVGGMAMVFLLVSGAAAVSDGCVQAIRLTKNCMVTLIPVLGTILAFSGNPVSAVTVPAAVFAFAQGVGVVFADLVVPLTAVGAALGSAAALSPMGGLERLAGLLNKGTAWGMGLLAGVFTAVLGVRGVVAGAADGATAKGLRFLIGGVPVVGSAIADALASLNGSLSLVKNGIAVLGVLCVLFICLPPLASLLVWKGMLHVLHAGAELLEMKRVPPFLNVLQSVFNTLLAVLLFNGFVYVIALAIVVSVKAM